MHKLINMPSELRYIIYSYTVLAWAPDAEYPSLERLVTYSGLAFARRNLNGCLDYFKSSEVDNLKQFTHALEKFEGRLKMYRPYYERSFEA